jgi:hypothetical protein
LPLNIHNQFLILLLQNIEENLLFLLEVCNHRGDNKITPIFDPRKSIDLLAMKMLISL